MMSGNRKPDSCITVVCDHRPVKEAVSVLPILWILWFTRGFPAPSCFAPLEVPFKWESMKVPSNKRLNGHHGDGHWLTVLSSPIAVMFFFCFCLLSVLLLFVENVADYMSVLQPLVLMFGTSFGVQTSSHSSPLRTVSPRIVRAAHGNE